MTTRLLCGAFGLVALLLAANALVAQSPGLYTVSAIHHSVVHIDPDAFTTSIVGPTGAPISFAELAYDPASKTPYCISGNDSSLYMLNLTTGAAQLIGDHGVGNLWGLAYDSIHNVLYGSRWQGETGELYRLDADTAQATYIGHMDIDIGALAYDVTNDRLIGLHEGRPAKLYEINRTTAELAVLGTYESVNSSGIAYDSDRDLFWAMDYDGQLSSFDPSNSYDQTVHPTQGVQMNQSCGLTYIPIPEPITLTLLALGGLALIRRRTKTI